MTLRERAAARRKRGASQADDRLRRAPPQTRDTFAPDAQPIVASGASCMQTEPSAGGRLSRPPIPARSPIPRDDCRDGLGASQHRGETGHLDLALDPECESFC